MKELAKKALKTGYGLGILSIGQAKKAASYARKELGLNEEECVKLAKELVNSSEKASRDVLKVVEKEFATVVVKSGIATKQDLSRIKNAVTGKIKKLVPRHQKEGIFKRMKRKVSRRKK